MLRKKNPEALISCFKQQGFKNVYDKESAVKKLAANTRPAIKKEPLTDIELVKRMKKSIQEALYHASDNIASDLPNKNMISDYLLRHSRGK